MAYLKKPEIPDGEVRVDEIGAKLLRAAEIIEERGWCQGRQEDDQGRVCFHGAISIAWHGRTHGTVPRDVYLERIQPILVALGVDPQEIEFGAASWNNAEGRTKEEVQAALRQAAHAR